MKAMRTLLAVWAVLWLFAAPAWAEGILVTIDPDVTVAGPGLTLGEISRITGDDQERVRALGAARLGNAPSPGHRTLLTADTLGTRLAATGFDLTGITWQVPPAITIATAAQTVSGESLAATATEALRRQLGLADDSDAAATISPFGAAADIMAPLGKVDLRAELPTGVRYNAPTSVVVYVSTDGRPFTSVSLRYTVKAYQRVVVAARNIAAKEEITADNVRAERREVGRLAGFVTDVGKVVGLAARRPITAGTLLTEAALDRPVILRRGAAVTILVQTGEMAVTAAGQALQDGREGDAVRVQNTNSKKTITARVVDAHTVQVVIYSGR